MTMATSTIWSAFTIRPTVAVPTPRNTWSITDEFTRFSNELRLQSSQDQRLRWIAGLFYQRQEHFYDLQCTVDEVDPASPSVESGDVVWQTNQKRVDKDFAIFGEAYFDITDNWTLIGGVREFKWNNSLYGFNGLF